MLIRYLPHSKSQRKNLSSYSSNQQTLVLKRRFQYNLCKQKLYHSFMHMFNVCTLYRKSIKLFHHKLW